jgi:hypothetical protein
MNKAAREFNFPAAFLLSGACFHNPIGEQR